MSTIKILDTHTINKIAAGEVVERPCSVIKELVENSIDAGSSSITVEIKNGGIDFIRVTDNGVGISKDEVEVAFLRHATSKIHTADDLLKVLTLGFRGEALASIASISHVELITKKTNDLTGKRVEVSGGKITSSEEIACPNGTTFMMRHIFYNVPARKEFLKAPTAEGAKISDYMTRLALAHPEISFKYIQNNKLLFTTSGNHDLTHAVLNVYNKETAKNTFKFYYKKEGIECVGLLGNTSLTRANRNFEHFFINGRYIKSTLLQKAVEDAYKTLITIGKFPFVILHLHIDPAVIDVNVHPTKMQVRFKEEEKIYNVIYEGILSQLRGENLVPTANPKDYLPHSFTSKPVTPKVAPIQQTVADTFFAPRKENNSPSPQSMLSSKTTLPQTHSSFSSKKEWLFGKMAPLEKQEPSLRSDSTKETSSLNPIVSEENTVKQVASPIVCENIPTKEMSKTKAMGTEFTIIGQFFKTYWMIEYGEKVFIIDQHSAHERVMYERFMKRFKEGEVASQLLLLPETVHLTESERALAEEEWDLFIKLGFKIEAFGETDIVIREVPFILNHPISSSVFKDVLDTLTHSKLEDITSLKEGAIIKMACRSAIKAHDRLSEQECKKLIEELMLLDNPFTCPHGRPTLVALTKTDVEKMFKRIQ